MSVIGRIILQSLAPDDRTSTVLLSTHDSRFLHINQLTVNCKPDCDKVNMSDEAEKIKLRANDGLRGAFGQTNEYDRAKMLALHWQKHDANSNFEPDAFKITDYFSQNLGSNRELFHTLHLQLFNAQGKSE